jgi:hypothetical protein
MNNVRSSIVNGRKHSLLLYKHLLDAGHVVENGNSQVGFCASYYSEVYVRGAEQNNGVSDEEGTPTTADDICASQNSNNKSLTDEKDTPATTD